MSDQHEDQPSTPDDEHGVPLEDVLREIMGGSVDPAILQSLSQMGMDRIDPAMVPLLKQQFQAMMNPAPAGVALDASAAVEVACGLVAEQGDPEIGDATARDVSQVVQVAELWLNDATEFAPANGAALAWSREDWVRHTMPVWARIVEPVAEGVSDATRRALGEQIRGALESGVQIPGLPPGMNPAALAGQMDAMLGRMSASMFAMQLGRAVGTLAGDVVSATEIGLPLVTREQVVLVPANVAQLAEEMQLDTGQVHLFLAVREAARVRLFRSVTWLGPQLIEAVRAYARDIDIDTEGIERKVTEAGTQDPEELQTILAESLFSPEPSAAQRAALGRLETYLALVEGWVDVVAQRAVAGRLPDVDALAESIRRRRATGGPAETAMAQLIGLQLRPRRLRDAANLWASLEANGGAAARDAAWAHPDVAPTAADLDDPLGYAERRAAGPASDDVDAELDRMLRDADGSAG